MQTRKIVLLDLDGTVCNTKHREHLAPPKTDREDTANWVPYCLACVDDEPIAGVVQVVRMLQETYPIFVVSGRVSEALWPTVEWLHGVGIYPENVRLHYPEDIRHNAEYKVAHIQYLRGLGYDPVLMIEDQVPVAEAVEAIGVPVLVTNPRFEDNIGVSFHSLSR